MTANDAILTPAAAPPTSGIRTKVPVVEFSYHDPAYGWMYAYASSATTQYNLDHYCGYAKGGIKFMAYEYDDAETPPAGMRLVAAAWSNTRPQASVLLMMPEGQAATAWKNGLAAGGYTWEEFTGYIYKEEQADEDTGALHHLVVPGNVQSARYLNNFFTTDPAVINSLRASGWQDLGSIGQAMAVYGAMCTYNPTTGKLELASTIPNAPGEPAGSFKVGSGYGNVIEIIRAPGQTFSLTNFTVTPADPAVIDVTTITPGMLSIRDNNFATTLEEYTFKVYGRLADGTSVQSDPKIINRSGAQ